MSEKITKTILSPKIEKRFSSINGIGIFTKKYIKKHEIIAIKSGHIYHKNFCSSSLDHNNNNNIHDFSIQISDDYILCASKKEELEDQAIFINHSCEANVGIQGQIIFIAMRDIEKNEELFIDYAMIWSMPYYMTCNCNKNSCRRIVTGDDWKLKELQEKYNGYFSQYLQNKINTLLILNKSKL